MYDYDEDGDYIVYEYTKQVYYTPNKKHYFFDFVKTIYEKPTDLTKFSTNNYTLEIDVSKLTNSQLTQLEKLTKGAKINDKSRKILQLIV